MTQKKDEQPRKYLAYVTLGDVFREGGLFIAGWLVISVVSLVVGGLFEYGQHRLGVSFNDVVSSAVPKWLWAVIIYGSVLWFGKGHEVRFTMPVVGFKSWLFFVLLFAGFVYVLENAEWWLATPFMWGYLLGFGALGKLSEKGKENFEKLNKNVTEP